MQQIADWLKTLGMSEYAERFAENAIDFSVLPDLTDQDLEKLGVLLGHRRKLLRAIADLKDIKKSEPEVAVAATITAASRPQDFAERRQVTVMFSDLVGSTALSARMDPEDLREVISAYQKCVAETVGHFGGFVAKYMGDGVLVYFGYPQAHEDDAERAIRAGLALIDAMAAIRLSFPILPQVRVGIATGVVVVGRVDWRGQFAGTRCSRRDIEPGRKDSGYRISRFRGGAGINPSSRRLRLRLRGARAARTQGHPGCGEAVARHR